VAANFGHGPLESFRFAHLRFHLPNTSNNITTGRIVACVFLFAFIGVSIYFGMAAWKWNSDFYEWIDARPMQMAVDLTTPATYSAPFTQICAMAHGQTIYVAYENPDANDENIAEHFAGLKGAVTIRDLTGATVLTKPFDANSVRLWGDDPILVGFHPFANGEYIAEIEIQQGASKIDGTQHDLYARNELCGLELIPAYILGAVSAVALLLACVVAFYTMPSIVRADFRI
jgi:hypothetical protein